MYTRRYYNFRRRKKYKWRITKIAITLQSPSAIVVVLWLPFVYYYAIFFSIFFSSRKKVNEPKENLPCRKTGFRREAHTRARQRSWPADRPVVDVNGPWPRSKKAHTRKLDEIIVHNGATVGYTHYAHAVKMTI